MCMRTMRNIISLCELCKLFGGYRGLLARSFHICKHARFRSGYPLKMYPRPSKIPSTCQFFPQSTQKNSPTISKMELKWYILGNFQKIISKSKILKNMQLKLVSFGPIQLDYHRPSQIPWTCQFFPQSTNKISAQYKKWY